MVDESTYQKNRKSFGSVALDNRAYFNWCDAHKMIFFRPSEHRTHQYAKAVMQFKYAELLMKLFSGKLVSEIMVR